jgi:hypothetical protein
MSHNYLFDLYNYISQRMETASAAPSPADASETAFSAGRVDALSAIQEYLDSHLHCKLPRRLQKKASGYMHAPHPHG